MPSGITAVAASAPEPPASGVAPGDVVLGRYTLERVLGRGGAGTVWSAIDAQLGRRVAVKSLPGDAGERALAEARASARLGHPAIVAVYGVGTAAARVWLVCEFVAGDTLRRTIVEDALRDAELLRIGVALCGALRHAHGRGIVHRDVTPRNVLVPHGAFDGERERGGGKRVGEPDVPAAKLADFGIARLADHEAPDTPGRIVGTLAYMAPERLRGGAGDSAGDLWALGVILHEALTGEHPAGATGGGRPVSELLERHSALPSLARRRPDLDPGLTAAIDRASAGDAQQRGTLADLEAALRRTLGVRTAPVAAEADPRARPAGAVRRDASPVRASRRPALVPLAPLAAALGGAVGATALPLAAVLALAALVLVAVGRTPRARRLAAGLGVLALAVAPWALVAFAATPGPVGGVVTSGAVAGALPAIAWLVTLVVGAALFPRRVSRCARTRSVGTAPSRAAPPRVASGHRR